MDANPAIPRRSNHPVCPIRHLQFMVIRNPSDAVAAPIPEALLAIADPAAPGVVAYRAELGNPMVLPEPAGPAQGPRPERREGPRTRGGRAQQAGAAGRGVLVVRGRGTSVGGAAVSQPTSSQNRPTGEAGASSSRPMLHRDKAPYVTEPPSPTPQVENIESDSDTDSEMARALRISKFSPRIGPNPDYFEGTSSASPRFEGVEGDELEHARRRELRSKTNQERSSRKDNEAHERIQPSDSRVATSTTPSHVLGRGIEEDSVDPAEQLHDPLIHSSVSQQTDVSILHGDIA